MGTDPVCGDLAPAPALELAGGGMVPSFLAFKAAACAACSLLLNPDAERDAACAMTSSGADTAAAYPDLS